MAGIIHLLVNLGFVVNFPKSLLEPTEVIDFLLDSTSMELKLPGDKIKGLRQETRRILAAEQNHGPGPVQIAREDEHSNESGGDGPPLLSTLARGNRMIKWINGPPWRPKGVGVGGMCLLPRKMRKA